MTNPITPAEAHRMAILIDTPTPTDFTARILGTLEHDHRCIACAVKIECSADCRLPADSPLVCHWCEATTR